MKKDNSTFKQKAALRISLLEEIENPVILETHGGNGVLYLACYQQFPEGCVIEKNGVKADLLAAQRPTWSVYEGDSLRAIEAGAGSHLKVNLLDLDPYGEPWPILDAFLKSDRPKPDKLAIAVNDGLRGAIQVAGAWHIESLRSVVGLWGNNLFNKYLEVCKYLIKEKAANAGYDVSRFWGYYTGAHQAMTHYAAVLTRPS